MEILEFPWRGGTSRFAPLICVENTYPPLPASAGRIGADFFLNITSEGLVGGPVQEQLLRIAMLRAIENRMSYVRVGNTGISGVIDATGRPALGWAVEPGPSLAESPLAPFLAAGGFVRSGPGFRLAGAPEPPALVDEPAD